MNFDHRGTWSSMLSVLGIILIYIAFSIEKGIHLGEAFVVTVLYLSGLASVIAGIVFGIKGILEKEHGILKYIGILLIIIAAISLTVYVKLT